MFDTLATEEDEEMGDPAKQEGATYQKRREDKATKILELLRTQYKEDKPQNTDQLRKDLLQACKGLTITQEIREILYTLGYNKEIPLEQQM